MGVPRPKRSEGTAVATVDVARQSLTLTLDGKALRTWSVSTGAAGVGGVEGSGKTPPGRHRVARLFGHGAEKGQVFVSRRAVKGHVIPRSRWRSGGKTDYVMTRILWLEGLEPGMNSGTNQEHLLGKPVSHGCIRMSNDDVVELFDFAKRHRNMIVEIVEGSR